MRFSVGQRVRVVSDEFDEDFVGAVGRVAEVDEDACYPYNVQFERAINGEDDRPFGEDEIVAVGVKVYEGVVDADGYIGDIEQVDAGDVWHVGEEYAGKRVRITVEEVDA